MGSFDEDQRPETDPAASQAELPLQSVLPNLDRISRSTFRKGTVSRRRVDRALWGLGAIVVIGAGVVALVVISQ